MKISTDTGCFQKYGNEKEIIKMLKEAGFTAYDFSIFCEQWLQPNCAFLDADDYVAKAKELRAYADSIGIECNQTHAPFPTAIKWDISPERSCKEYNEKMYVLICRALEVSGILGAKVCVVHPCNDYTAEENAQFYKQFESVARKAGVKIGLENMWNWNGEENHAAPAACSHHDDFRKHLELLPSDVFVACLDIGHSEMYGLDTSAVQMIETLNERLAAIHLHDVDGHNDNHQIPFTQNINFENVIQAFKKVGYKGDITFESCNSGHRAPKELLPSLATYMASIGNYFKNRLENC